MVSRGGIDLIQLKHCMWIKTGKGGLFFGR
jgi:hypothetical protein